VDLRAALGPLPRLAPVVAACAALGWALPWLVGDLPEGEELFSWVLLGLPALTLGGWMLLVARALSRAPGGKLVGVSALLGAAGILVGASIPLAAVVAFNGATGPFGRGTDALVAVAIVFVGGWPLLVILAIAWLVKARDLSREAGEAQAERFGLVVLSAGLASLFLTPLLPAALILATRWLSPR